MDTSRKSIFSRVIAIIITFCVMVTTLGSTIASALQISYPWSYSTYPYFNTKVSAINGSGEYVRLGEQIVPFTIQGKDNWGFCIEPSAKMGGSESGGIYYVRNSSETSASDIWNGFSSDQQKLIETITYYGYPYQHTGYYYFYASQLLIWEVILGFRNSDMTMVSGCDRLYNAGNVVFHGSQKTYTIQAYEDILKKVQRQYKDPEDVTDSNGNEVIYSSKSEAESNVNKMYYNFDEQRYETTFTFPNDYLESSYAYAYSNLKADIEATGLSVSTKEGSSYTTFTVYTTSQFDDTKTAKTSQQVGESIDTEAIYVTPSKQTIYNGTVSPSAKTAYISFEVPDNPNVKVYKKFKTSSGTNLGTTLSKSEFEKYCNECTFIVRKTIGTTVYYVKFTKSSSTTGGWVFNGFTDDINEATEITPIVTTKDSAYYGYFALLNLPAKTDANVSYMIIETEGPDDFTLASNKKISVAKLSNGTTKTYTMVNTQEISPKWGNVTVEKDLFDANGNTKVTTDNVKEIANAYDDTKFVVAVRLSNDYNDFTSYTTDSGETIEGGKWFYLKDNSDGSLAKNPNNFAVYTNSGDDLDTYVAGDGCYWLYTSTSTSTSYGTRLQFDNLTSNINKAAVLTVGHDYTIESDGSLTLGEHFGEIYLNGVPLNSEGVTLEMVFIEVEHAEGYASDTTPINAINGLTGLNKLSAGESRSISGIRYSNDYQDANGMQGGTSPCVGTMYKTSSNGTKKSSSVGCDSIANYEQYILAQIKKTDEDTGDTVEGATYGLYSSKSTKSLVEKRVTGSDGIAKFTTHIAVGETYYIREISSPVGYTVDKTWYEVTPQTDGANTARVSQGALFVSSSILLDTQTTNVKETPYKLTIKIEKEDDENDIPVIGAEFKVITTQKITYNGISYTMGQTIASLKTDDNGEASLTGLPLGGYNESTGTFNNKYVVVETGVPEPYVIDDTSYSIDAISEDNITDSTNGVCTYTLNAVNTPQRVNLSVVKKGEITNALLKGVVFDVYANEDIVLNGYTLYKKDECIGQLSPTDENGIALSEYEIEADTLAGTATYTVPIYAGFDYYLLEEADTVPNGYVATTDKIEFTADFTNAYTSTIELQLTVENTPTQVHISKETDSEYVIKSYIDGTKWQIIDEAGNVIDEWETTGDEFIRTYKLQRGATYTLHQTYAPEGVEMADDVTFTVSTDGLIMRAGAVLQILDSNGKVVDEWTSTDDVHELIAVLTAGETYTLHEVEAPDGYVLADDITFTVSTDGSIDYVYMNDDTTKVSIMKVSKSLYSAAAVVGAEMELYDLQGNLIDSWTTDSGDHYLEGVLVSGETYTLHEVSAPAGYVVANDIRFTVSSDGSVDYVIMYDDTTKVKLSKYDITNEEELKGAELQVLDLEGNVLDEWTSSEEPYYIEGVLTAGETYVLHETYAPHGYLIANDVEFTVNDNGSVNVVKMYDDVTKVKLDKVYESDAYGNLTVGNTYQIIDSDENVISEATITETVSEEDETITFVDPWNVELTIGKYTVTDGEDTITVKVLEDGTYNIVDLVSETVVGTTNISLEGAQLQLIDQRGHIIDEWTSTTEPHYLKCFLTAGATYTLHETYAPAGYVIADDVEFTVSTDGSVDYIVMVDDSTKVSLNKICDNLNAFELIVGDTYQILDANGNVVAESTITEIVTETENTTEETEETTEATETEETTETIIANWAAELTIGKYTLVNTSTEESMTFVVDEDEEVDIVEIVENQKYNYLEGAVLQIIDAQGNVVDEWTSNGQEYFLEAVLTAGESYTLHEVYAPDGYVLSDDIQFTVSLDGSIDTITMFDDSTKVKLSKKDITNDEELEGAELQIIDSEGNVIDEWTSSTEPHYIEAVLVAGETYTLHETYAPAGFVIANDVEFTVSENGDVDYVEMIDDTTKVKITKYDITDSKELEGAELVIYDDEGNVVDSWTSTTEAHYLECVLVAGETYTLHEEVAPNGYVVASDIEFTVSEDGSIDVVEMYDDTTKVKITKYDITDSSELEGAELVIYDSEGNVVDTWTSTDEAHYIEGTLIAGETYTLHEEVAPNGYVVASDIEFTVSEDGSIDVVEMYDDTTKVKITKYDITGGNEIEGAELVIYDSEGNVVDTWTSTTEAHYIEGTLIAGETYTLHEEVAPNGYVVANDIEFTVSTDGGVDIVEMFDDTTKVDINKVDENGNALSGATLQVLGADDEVVAEWTTDGTTYHLEAVLTAGATYTLHEVSAPSGYAVADDIEFTVAEDGSLQTITMTDTIIPTITTVDENPHTNGDTTTASPIALIAIITSGALGAVVIAKKRKDNN